MSVYFLYVTDDFIQRFKSQVCCYFYVFLNNFHTKKYKYKVPEDGGLTKRGGSLTLKST
jgi:hypothetical protein